MAAIEKPRRISIVQDVRPPLTPDEYAKRGSEIWNEARAAFADALIPLAMVNAALIRQGSITWQALHNAARSAKDARDALDRVVIHLDSLSEAGKRVGRY